MKITGNVQMTTTQLSFIINEKSPALNSVNFNIFSHQGLEVEDPTDSRNRSRLLYVPNQYGRNEEANWMHRCIE